MRKILRIINWIVLGLCAFIVSSFLFGNESMNEGNSSIATLMVVLALTGMVWVPVGFIASVWSLVLEYRLAKEWKPLFKQPAVYVCSFMLILLTIMFS